MRLVPPNALPRLWVDQHQGGLPRRFVVVGAGKTAMDAAIWLIRAGASPDAIQWVMPRDSWLVNRITTQPAAEFFNETIGGQAEQMEACALAVSTDDLFLRLEARGALMRIHPERKSTMFHLATIAPGEADVLRRIRDIVRLGRVQRIAQEQMVLEQGRVPVAPGTLFIDCTASAVEPRLPQPIVGAGQGIAPVGTREPARRFWQADDGHRLRGQREAGHHGPHEAGCGGRDGQPAEADPGLRPEAGAPRPLQA